MMRLLLAAALLAAAAPTSVAAQTAPADYSKAAHWICLPGRTDTCTTPLRTTALNPNGYGSTGRSTVAKDSGVDCFVVYPTISRDSGMNSDLVADDEKDIVESQFARLSGGCRMIAPVYRSMTVSAVAASAAGADMTQPAMLAYGDVRAAWQYYLAHLNKGRPYVLVGHSQGSLMLIRLLAREIEGKPEAKRMQLAILPGFNVMVPQGKTVGGTFKATPLCTSAGQTGCVMTWVSFRERNVPPPGALFGYADQPGMTVGCTNPGRPGATGWVALDSYWDTTMTGLVPGGPIQWSSEGPPPSPYLRTEGLVSARCVNDGPRGYLSIRTNPSPGGKRTDRVGGEVGLLGFFLPGWGMHLIDVSAAQGDILRRIEALNPPPAQARTDSLAPLQAP